MKDIPGFEGLYAITEDGKVFALPKKAKKSGRWITDFATKTGYRRVKLSKDGKQINRAVHRLVALTYIPNPENKETVNHKNGKPWDNRVENLEWMTLSENIQHAYDTGLKKQVMTEEHKRKIGEANKISHKGMKLSEEHKRKIGEAHIKHQDGDVWETSCGRFWIKEDGKTRKLKKGEHNIWS